MSNVVHHQLVHNALRAARTTADPQAAVMRAVSFAGDSFVVQTIDGRHIHVGGTTIKDKQIKTVGAGKAGVGMAVGLQQVLAAKGCEASGLVIVKDGFSGGHKAVGGIEIVEAAHPLPDERNLAAAAAISGIVAGLGEGDILFVLLSGGGSALLESPAYGLTIADLVSTVRTLMHAGADIAQLNTVRKQLSSLKGGRLAQLAWPASIITLIISDVIGDDPSLIASGPTVYNPTGPAAALAVIAQLGVADLIPLAVIQHLQSFAQYEAAHPQAAASRADFSHCHTFIIAANAAAVAAAQQELLTHLPLVGAYSYAGVTDDHASLLPLFGEARDTASRLVEQIGTHLADPRPLLAPTNFAPNPAAPAQGWAIILGGETSVTVRGDGRGGRNQEFALAAAVALDMQREQLAGYHVSVASFATDGDDGYGGAAGAIATLDTVSRARAVGLDPAAYLGRNDSHTFWQQLAARYPTAPSPHLITGPSGTNINDVCVIIVENGK